MVERFHLRLDLVQNKQKKISKGPYYAKPTSFLSFNNMVIQHVLSFSKVPIFFLGALKFHKIISALKLPPLRINLDVTVFPKSLRKHDIGPVTIV